VLIQSVWNYENLQAVGFAWALLPGLERLYPERSERAARLLAYLEPFNSNPYLATLGLGLALRMESEIARGAVGAEERLDRLLRAVRGSLGAIGDDLFWTGWRPALGLLAALAAVWTQSSWTAVAFLVGYNGLAQAVRREGVDAGYATGAGIARALRRPFWTRTARTAKSLGAFGGGVALGAGAVVAWTGGGPGREGVFLSLVALLWLAGSAGRRRRPLAPSLALLITLIVLSLLSIVEAGVTPT